MTTHTNTLPQTKGTRETKDYRFDRFRAGLMLADMRFSKDALKPGDILSSARGRPDWRTGASFCRGRVPRGLQRVRNSPPLPRGRAHG